MLTHTQFLENWFKSMDENLRLTLFGQSLANVYATVNTGKITKDKINPNKTNFNGLPEIPLSGPAYTDFSLSYVLEPILKGDVTNSALADTLPLLEKIAVQAPDVKNFFMEFDAGSGKDTVHPSLFFKIKNIGSAYGLIALLKQEANHPHRWEVFEKIWEQLKDQWSLPYIGLMPGRENSPIRIILSPFPTKSQDNPVEYLKNLLTALNYPFPCDDLLHKFKTLSQINRDIPHSASYTLCLDLLPEGTWGKTIGMEVFQQLLNGKKQIIASYREKLVRQFANWQLIDERADLLSECEKLLLIPDPETDKKTLLCSYLSHFKLRWQEGKPLPAKAYFQIREV